MKIIIERRISAAAIWARRFAVFSAVLFATAGAGHRFGAVETVAFLWLLGLVAALAILALLLAVVGFVNLWEHGARGGRASTLAALVAVLVLAPFGLAGVRAFTLPRINDISTDMAEAPSFVVAQRLRIAGMNRLGDYLPETAVLQAAAYPQVTGRRYTLPAPVVADIVVLLLSQRGWRVTRDVGMQLERGEATIEAIAPSPVFGFISDVAIRLTDEGETAYVDMRSASRYGTHDIGDNAARITAFLSDLDQMVMTRSTTGLQPAE